MDEGVNRTIFELFMMILPVAIFLLIGSAILVVSKPDFSRAYMLEKEVSYISSMASENMVVELDLKNTKYQNLKINTKDNKVSINVNGQGSKLESFGGSEYQGNAKIEQENENALFIYG